MTELKKYASKDEYYLSKIRKLKALNAELVEALEEMVRHCGDFYGEEMKLDNRGILATSAAREALEKATAKGAEDEK